MQTIQQEIDERTNLTSSNKLELLLFRLGVDANLDRNELFGINVFKIREIIPISEQQVRIQVPDGRRVSKAQLLVSGKTPVWRQTGNVVSVTVPSIELHEVVALDLVS